MLKQICELGNRPNILSHHLSLPKTSGEVAAMEKLLQLQDTVPCKVRAKRGCATHPRSIAERVNCSLPFSNLVHNFIESGFQATSCSTTLISFSDINIISYLRSTCILMVQETRVRWEYKTIFWCSTGKED